MINQLTGSYARSSRHLGTLYQSHQFRQEKVCVPFFRFQSLLRRDYLEQERGAVPGKSVIETLSRRTGIAQAEHELEESASALAQGAEANDRYSSALERFLSRTRRFPTSRATKRAAALCHRVGRWLALFQAVGARNAGRPGGAPSRTPPRPAPQPPPSSGTMAAAFAKLRGN